MCSCLVEDTGLILPAIKEAIADIMAGYFPVPELSVSFLKLAEFGYYSSHLGLQHSYPSQSEDEEDANQ